MERKAVIATALVTICFCCWNASAAAAAASKSRQIKPGDRIEVAVTCRLPSGELVMTTDKALAYDPKQKKATIFAHLEKYEPLRIVAGERAHYSGDKPLKPFNNELLALLSDALQGMHIGQQKTLTLRAPVPEGLPGEERYIQLALKRARPKTAEIPVDQFRSLYKKDPAVGDPVDFGMGISSKVAAIENTVAIIHFDLKDGDVIETPWGPADIKETETEYEIHIRPELGRLVRTGAFVGKVAEILPDRYTMDFGYPFGGEAVVCEIEVLGKIEKQE